MKQELIEGRDYYLTPEGMLTFTAFYLSSRGYCCGNGCRHCPYDYAAVPEPQRSQLLQQRNHLSSTRKNDPQ